jgi:hypothetical protein
MIKLNISYNLQAQITQDPYSLFFFIEEIYVM